MELQTRPSPTVDARSDIAIKNTNWPYLLALGFITLASILIRLYVGSKSFMDFDEWQHVFIASAPRSTDFRYELMVIAHPALFLWMLRGVVHLGRGLVFYRLISILAGGGSVFLVGLICRKVCRNAAVALLGATALALSSTGITISTEVRSYELSVCFALLAFLCYLNLFPSARSGPRLSAYLGFPVAMCLALNADYSTAFILGACVATWVVLAVAIREYRPRFSSTANWRRLLLLLASFAAPVLVVIEMYMGPLRHQQIQGYLYDFYWSFKPGETQLEFLLRNGLNEWNWFSPVAIQNPTLFICVAAILAAVAICLFVLNLRAKGARGGARVPFPLAVLIILALIVLSFDDAYLFGGRLRQQYILFPFLVIAIFSVVDVIAPKRNPTLRIGVPVVLTAAILIHFVAVAPNLSVLGTRWARLR